MSCDLLLDRLAANAQKTPDKQATAFIAPGSNGGKIEKKLTYQELEQETSELASRLVAAGIQKGDRCVICAGKLILLHVFS